MKESGNALIHIDTTELFTSDEINELATRDIAVALVNEIGPAGGNPEYAMIGQPADLIAWLTENVYGDNEEEILELWPELGPDF